MEVVSPKSRLVLGQLDLGEREAIALAAEVHADVVLMDEQAGRQEALRRGLTKVAGTSMKPNKPVSSILTWPSLSFKRPASAFRRRCSRIFGQDGLADSLEHSPDTTRIGFCPKSWHVLQ